MLEQKLVVGKFFNLTLVPPAMPPFANGDFVLVPVQQCYLMESSGVFTKTSLVQAGPGPKAHRNFKWLPWVPGAISEVALTGGADVLTGPMSGCWLATYRKPNGVPHAVHLGTDVGKDVENAAVNGAWNAFALANPVDIIGGFNPIRHWVGAFPARRGDDDNVPPTIFGLFTTAGEFHIIVAFKQAAPAPGTLLRIAGIQQIPTSTLARLQAVDQPGP
jgi:hypothetical protein